MKYEVAIIGFGASGVEALIGITDAACELDVSSRTRVHIISSATRWGVGFAYATSNPAHVLNSPAIHLQSDYDAKFPRLNSELAQISHPPRMLVGDWLEERAHNAVTRAIHSGLTIDHHYATAMDQVRHHGKFEIELSGNGIVQVDALVLCVGNIPSRRAAQGLTGLRSVTPRIDGTIPRDIADSRKLLILGTGLSSIDFIHDLERDGYDGEVTLVSRSGRFPDVRPEKTSTVNLKSFQRDKLVHALGKVDRQQLEVLKNAFFQTALENGVSNSACHLFSQTSHSGQSIDGADQIKRFAIIEHLDSIFPFLWRTLSPYSKRKFLHHHDSEFLKMTAPMTPGNADAVHRWVSEKRISVRTMASLDREYEVKSRAFDLIVDCTGAHRDVATAGQPILTSLLLSGQIVASPYGGLKTDFDTGLAMATDGVIRNGIGVAGHLTIGTHYGVNCLVQNTRMAAIAGRKVLTGLVKSHY